MARGTTKNDALNIFFQFQILDKSFFVSTTLSYNTAFEFAEYKNKSGNKYIIYYVLPKNPDLFSNSHIFVKSDEKIAQICKKLPIYSGATVYPDQKEISIKGCLFSKFCFKIELASTIAILLSGFK